MEFPKTRFQSMCREAHVNASRTLSTDNGTFSLRFNPVSRINCTAVLVGIYAYARVRDGKSLSRYRRLIGLGVTTSKQR